MEFFNSTPVTGCGGSYSCETSMFPHFLDNQLIDGGEVVKLQALLTEKTSSVMSLCHFPLVNTSITNAKWLCNAENDITLRCGDHIHLPINKVNLQLLCLTQATLACYILYTHHANTTSHHIEITHD
jgi:hypothetical protein